MNIKEWNKTGHLFDKKTVYIQYYNHKTFSGIFDYKKPLSKLIYKDNADYIYYQKIKYIVEIDNKKLEQLKKVN